MSQVKGRVSVIIPGRNEKYFQATVGSVLERATGDIEIVAIEDGEAWQPQLASNDPRVKIIRLDKSIGQRAGYNLGVRESSGEFVMKIDAHALLSPGFDETLKAHCPPKTTVLPVMRRLDVHRWEHKPRGYVSHMFFGLDMYCHGWREYRHRPEAQTDYPEVMTGQGSCWFTTREWNDYIGLLDEKVGSWGNVGIEISLRTWLCGGQQIVNPQAWQAHYFRKDEGGFPYSMTGRDVGRAHAYTRDNYYFNNHAFEHQERPFAWIIEHFAPVPGWEAYLVDQFTAPRVIVYYTDSKLDPKLANQVRKRLKQMVGPIPIISVSQEPLRFGTNICVGEKPNVYRSLYEQLLVGLEAAPEDSIVYLCEHDVFYHPSHFAFIPPNETHAFFNTNRYYYRLGCKNFLQARGRMALSQCVAHREVLITHCQERLAKWDAGEESRMLHSIPFSNFKSDRPNIDIRNGENLTPDGDYKRAYYKGKAPDNVTVMNLPGWGSPGHFQKKSGYKEPVEPGTQTDAAKYLNTKFRRWLPQVSPVRCPKFRRTALWPIFNQLGFKKGAEIGVSEGKNAECLFKAVPELELLCVDQWAAYWHFTAADMERRYAAVQERLAPYNAKLMRMSSIDGAREVPDESLDFVYVDADHRFDWVMEDIIAWARKVRPGGIVAGHDYWRFRGGGVVQAVDVYTQMHSIDPWFITDEKEASFFWVKP